EDVDETVFDRIMAVNVKGVWLGAKYALPVMKRQRRGVFLITASTAATRPRRGGQTYAASKGAVVTLTKSLALEAAPHGVRVVAIAPVATEAPMPATFMAKLAGRGAGGSVRAGSRPELLAPVASPRRSARGRRGRGRIRLGQGRRLVLRGHERGGPSGRAEELLISLSSPSHVPGLPCEGYGRERGGRNGMGNRDANGRGSG